MAPRKAGTAFVSSILAWYPPLYHWLPNPCKAKLSETNDLPRSGSVLVGDAHESNWNPNRGRLLSSTVEGQEGCGGGKRRGNENRTDPVHACLRRIPRRKWLRIAAFAQELRAEGKRQRLLFVEDQKAGDGLALEVGTFHLDTQDLAIFGDVRMRRAHHFTSLFISDLASVRVDEL
jgi:hypothetical protein